MKQEIIENINELFDSYDLFSGTGREKIRTNIATKYPDISETERKEIEDYLDDFYKYCVTYANKLADKYGVPFLPSNDTAKQEIDEYVRICKEKFIEIDEKQIVKLFSTVCWLANR